MDSRIIIEGESGIGKSYAALYIAQLLDKRATQDPEGFVNEQIVFKASEFVNAARRLPSFSCLIFDEPGQGWHHREFTSEASIILSKLTIGFRYRHLITFYCVPALTLIDKDARTLVSFLVNVVRHGEAEVFKQLPQKFGGDPFWKTIADRFILPMPDVRLRHLYDAKKEGVQDKLYAEFGKTLDKGEQPRITNAEIVAKILQNPSKYQDGRGEYVVSSIAGLEDVGRERAAAIRAKLMHIDGGV